VAEFDLIQRYFAVRPPQHRYNLLGIGDDCALSALPPDMMLAVTADTMVENVHFFADVDPADLGHKLLAVNLSDLAAMAAEPFAVTLALTLPRVDAAWLQAFSAGFLGLAQRFSVDLIGGDTTQGPLTLTVQAMGAVPSGQALRRNGARVGDGIYVTGLIGEGGLGLKIKQGYVCDSADAALTAFNRPMPCVSQGLALRGLAHACIDISDGLAQDLGHILRASAVGALLVYRDVPRSAALQAYVQASGDWQLPLLAGDDYQLCFTAPIAQEAQLPPGCRRIGEIQAEPGLRIQRDGEVRLFEGKGFEHFAA
jgi:thiamine-monophosphate kinase